MADLGAECLGVDLCQGQTLSATGPKWTQFTRVGGLKGLCGLSKGSKHAPRLIFEHFEADSVLPTSRFLCQKRMAPQEGLE